MFPNKFAELLTAGKLPGAEKLANATSLFQGLLEKAGLDKVALVKPGTDKANTDRTGLGDWASLLKQGPLKQGRATGAEADPRFRRGSFTNEAGTRPYRLYVPERALPQHPALIVMLHGCTQSPEDFAAGTRMNVLAEQHGFLVLYPGQVSSANANGCWNWFRVADQKRDEGEPSIIAGMTRLVLAEHAIDTRRVFAAGLSAGGAAAATLGAVYPDLFTAIGVHSGLAHGSAHDMPSAFAAMSQGRAGDGRITVPAIIFQGDRDSTVSIKNADALTAQALPVGRAAIETVEGNAGRPYTRTSHVSAGGRVVLERWIIHGAGHAWSGGDPSGSYTDPKGPDASNEMLRFFFGS